MLQIKEALYKQSLKKKEDAFAEKEKQIRKQFLEKIRG